jgi:hypothetical protein
MKQTFTAILRDGGVEVPFDVKAVFGQARAPVKMTFCGETHRNRVMVYGGKYVLGIWKAVLAKHRLEDGQPLEVTLEPDAAPRTIEVPRELAKHAKAWAALSYTHQREWANAIADAKKPETRARRVAQALEALTPAARPSKAFRARDTSARSSRAAARRRSPRR